MRASGSSDNVSTSKPNRAYDKEELFLDQLMEEVDESVEKLNEKASNILKSYTTILSIKP